MSEHLRVCVCVCMCACMCVCVCVRDIERERPNTLGAAISWLELMTKPRVTGWVPGRKTLGWGGD